MKKGKSPAHKYYEIDERFFSNWSPKMAWVLGLLYTDGYMIGNNIRLRMNDKDVIEKVTAHLKYSKPVAILYYNKNPLYNVEFQREVMADDLRKLGLHSSKSFTLKFPDMPNEMIRHFIRGCWDGDGGFGVKNEKVVAYYTTGSKEFLIELVMRLFEAGVYRKILRRPTTMEPDEWHKEVLALKELCPNKKYPYRIYKRKNNNAFDIRISLPESLYNLYMYLYDNVDESIYMERKYYKFHNALFKDKTTVKHRSNIMIETINTDFYKKWNVRKKEMMNFIIHENGNSKEDKEMLDTESNENGISIKDLEMINTEFYENKMSINNIAGKSGLSKNKIIWNLGKFKR